MGKMDRFTTFFSDWVQSVLPIFYPTRGHQPPDHPVSMVRYHLVDDCGVRGVILIPQRTGFELGHFLQLLAHCDWPNRTLLREQDGFLTEEALRREYLGMAEWTRGKTGPTTNTHSWYQGELHGSDRQLCYRINPDPLFLETCLDGLSFGRLIVNQLQKTSHCPDDVIVSQDWRVVHQEAEIGCSFQQPIAIVEQWF